MRWGSSSRRGGGPKLRALPRKFVFLGFRREESGMSRTPGGVFKKLCKKSLCACFAFRSSKLPTLTLPENILGHFWLAEC